uniref:Uncharacterized protein n=1 Tax=Chenopodium quinoa TaxID=63459 RepID=A0A803L8A4_CHEQI
MDGWEKEGAVEMVMRIEEESLGVGKLEGCLLFWETKPGLKRFLAECQTWYPVTMAMNKASFDGPECIKEGDVKEKAEAQASLQPTCCGRTVAEIMYDVTTLSPTSEKFLAYSKPSTDELGKLSQTPLKKSKVKSGAEKQATLCSYFTKS